MAIRKRPRTPTPPRPSPPSLANVRDPDNPAYAGGRREPVAPPPSSADLFRGIGQARDLNLPGIIEFPNQDVAEWGTPEKYWEVRNLIYSHPEGARWAYVNGGDRFVDAVWIAAQGDVDYATDYLAALSVRPPPDPMGTRDGSGRGGRGGFGGGGGGGPSPEDYAAAEASIRNRAAMLGLSVEADGISALAKAVVDGQWTADMLDDYLVNGLESNRMEGRLQGGQYTGATDQIKKLAADQLVPISDDTAREWARRLLSGELDEGGVKSMLQAMATMHHPWAKDAVARGISVKDLALPLRDTIAGELEMAPEAVDLTNTKWQQMLYVTDDKGQQRIATRHEVVQRARQTDEFTNSSRAIDMGATLGTMLRDVFEGRVR